MNEIFWCKKKKNNSPPLSPKLYAHYKVAQYTLQVHISKFIFNCGLQMLKQLKRKLSTDCKTDFWWCRNILDNCDKSFGDLFLKVRPNEGCWLWSMCGPWSKSIPNWGLWHWHSLGLWGRQSDLAHSQTLNCSRTQEKGGFFFVVFSNPSQTCRQCNPQCTKFKCSVCVCTSIIVLLYKLIFIFMTADAEWVSIVCVSDTHTEMYRMSFSFSAVWYLRLGHLSLLRGFSTPVIAKDNSIQHQSLSYVSTYLWLPICVVSII